MHIYFYYFYYRCNYCYKQNYFKFYKFNYSGSAYVFQSLDGNQWTQVAQLLASDRGAHDEFGSSISLYNNLIAVGAIYVDDTSTGGTDAGKIKIIITKQ